MPNGEFSGDVLYSAFGTDVQAGGAILREFKRIKNWSVLHDAEDLDKERKVIMKQWASMKSKSNA